MKRNEIHTKYEFLRAAVLNTLFKKTGRKINSNRKFETESKEGRTRK